MSRWLPHRGYEPLHPSYLRKRSTHANGLSRRLTIRSCRYAPQVRRTPDRRSSRSPFRTGCRAARVDGQLLPANITLVILVTVGALARGFSAEVALVILVDVSTFTENLAADITVMVFVSVGVCRFIGFSAADDAGVPMCVCIARPVGGVTAHGQHFAADIAHVVIVRVVAHTDGQLTNITTVVPVGVLVRRFPHSVARRQCRRANAFSPSANHPSL